MSVNRFNYTDRLRLAREHMKFYIYSYPDESIFFVATLNFDEYELPSESEVVVEVYREHTNKRYTLGNPTDSVLTIEEDISDFSTAESIHFRVKVISLTKPGLLLALADGISPRAEHLDQDTSSSLLKVCPNKDLGQEIFKLNIETEPELLINSDISNWREFVQEPKFKCLVFPSIFRQILVRILIIDDNFDVESDDWYAHWLHYALKLVNTDLPGEGDDPETIHDWIDQVVSAFSRKFSMLKDFMKVADEFHG